MAVKPKRNQKHKSSKFHEQPFDLGRDKSWFNSSRKSGESWCKGGDGKGSKSTKKDEY